jgi:heme/copper-type cytochrome/quinol oxidase subunit 2
MNPIYIPIVTSTSNQPTSPEAAETLASVLLGMLVVITIVYIVLELTNIVLYLIHKYKKRHYDYDFPADMLLDFMRIFTFSIYSIILFIWVSYKVGSMF